MKNAKHTKKALLASVMSLLVCCAMLIGTTFAWFTDSVSTGVNRIVAGNLDVEMYSKAENGEYKPVDKDIPLFKTDALWEPGHVEYVNLKVANLGTLALEYKFDISVIEKQNVQNVYKEALDLTKYIKFSVIDGERNYTADDRAKAIEDAENAGAEWISELSVDKHNMLAPDEEEYVTLVIYMPTTVGNEANQGNYDPSDPNFIPRINLGITLLARQTPAENDSFGNDYDANAEYAFSAEGQADIIALLKQGKPVVLSKDINVVNVYDNPIYLSLKGVKSSVDLGGRTVTLEDQTLDSVFEISNGANLTLKGNGTVKSETYTKDYCMAVYTYGTGVANIESGYYVNEGAGADNQYDLIYAEWKSAINISGGKFKCQTPQWTLNCKDHKDGNTATITVTGGMFYKYDPVKVAKDNTSATGEDGEWYVGAGEIIVPEGYTSVRCDESGTPDAAGDWYKVVAE